MIQRDVKPIGIHRNISHVYNLDALKILSLNTVLVKNIQASIVLEHFINDRSLQKFRLVGASDGLVAGYNMYAFISHDFFSCLAYMLRFAPQTVNTICFHILCTCSASLRRLLTLFVFLSCLHAPLRSADCEQYLLSYLVYML